MRVMSFALASVAFLWVAGCDIDSTAQFYFDPSDGGRFEDSGIKNHNDGATDGSNGGAREDAVVVDAGIGPCKSSSATEPNDDFAHATRVEIGDTIAGVIDHPGDHDFYCFVGSQGQWVRLYTNVGETDAPSVADPILTLYDGEAIQLANNDTSWPPANTDAEIIVRLPYSGTYFLRARNLQPDLGGSDYRYPLNVLSALPSTGVAIELEVGDDPEDAGNILVDTTRRAVVGTFRDGEDIDFYRFTVDDTVRIRVNRFALGSRYDGFTSPPGFRMNLCSPGNACFASDGATDSLDLGDAPPGEYFLMFRAPIAPFVGEVTYGARIVATRE